jgi:hypothetical protein
MVVQSVWNSPRMAGRSFYPRVLMQARLGCPDAVAWLRRKRRLENGTYLTRMHWSRKPRALNFEQSIDAQVYKARQEMVL